MPLETKKVEITCVLPSQRIFYPEKNLIKELPCEAYKCIVEIPIDMPGEVFAKAVEAAILQELVRNDSGNWPRKHGG